MIKGVIFDMDGVLIDNRDAHIEAFTRLFKKYGVPFDREKFMPSFGMTNDMIFARQAPELLERYPLEQLSLEKEALYRSIFEESIAPTRGLVDFLKSLKEHGIKIAVGSSGNTNNVNFVLSRCRIAEYFDAIANGGGTPGRNGCRGVGHYFFARPDSRLRYPGRRFHTAWL